MNTVRMTYSGVARNDALDSVTARLNATDAYADLPVRVRYVLDLALEELITNIVKYAGSADGAAPPHLELELGICPEGCELTLRDDGAPFDPLALPPPDLAADLLERPVGGLGVHLIRELADTLSYRRCNGCNELNLRLGV